jgi:hypothetical protein
MDQKQYQDGEAWKSDIAVNGVQFQGTLPGSVVEQLVDAGGELLSANSVEHHRIAMGTNTGDYERRHVLWFKFLRESIENEQINS